MPKIGIGSLGIGVQGSTLAKYGKREWNFEADDTALGTFSRTGGGTAWTAAGVLVSFGSGIPRITTNGLLLEPASTNQMANNTLPVAATRWSEGASSPTNTLTGQTSDVAAGPDGTITATRMTQRFAAGGSQQQRAYVVAAAGTQPLACFSGCLKYEGYRYVALQTSAGGGNQTVFDLLDGTVHSGLGGIKTKGNGWFHCHTPVQAVVTTGHVTWLAFSNPLSQTQFVGDGASSYLATLWQLELNVSVPSSPIITGGSQASRGADAATLKVPAGCTGWDAVYGDARTAASGSGLTPGASFDLVTGRPWIGLGNELKNIRFKP